MMKNPKNRILLITILFAIAMLLFGGVLAFLLLLLGGIGQVGREGNDYANTVFAIWIAITIVGILPLILVILKRHRTKNKK